MFEFHIFLYGILKRNYIQTHPSPNVLQGIRQRNRTNLLTAKQSLNLLLITTICGGGSTFVNVIYPAIKGQKPEIMWVSDSIRCLDIFISSFFFPRQNPGASLPDSCRHSGWDRGDLLQLSWEWPLKWLCNYFKTFWMTFELICKNVQALRMTCGICVKILKPWERKFCVKI